MTQFSQESDVQFDMFIQAVKCVVGYRGLVYVTVPIITGKSLFLLMNELNCTAEEAKTIHKSRYNDEVFEKNMSAAESWTELARNSFPKRVVLDPSRLYVKSWGQPEYYELWNKVITEYADIVVATPDWAFSNGARAEVDMAFAAKRTVVDVNGVELSKADIQQYDEIATNLLREWRWSEEKISLALNPMSLGGQHEQPPTGILRWARNEALSWVHEDLNNYEVRSRRELGRPYYTPSSDDERTRRGYTGPDTWNEKLHGYWEKMLSNSCKTNVGRLELGSLLGASIAMLRSVWRIHGPLTEHKDMQNTTWNKPNRRISPAPVDYESQLQLSNIKSSVWSWVQNEYSQMRSEYSDAHDRDHTLELVAGNSRPWEADIWDLHWNEVLRLGLDSQEGKYHLGQFTVCIFRLFEAVIFEYGAPPRREWRDHSRELDGPQA